MLFSSSNVLHFTADNPRATMVGDPSVPGVLPEEAFDCLVFTETLHYNYDMHAAVAEMHSLEPRRSPAPNMPRYFHVDRGDWGANRFWSITRPAAEGMFAGVFGAANVAVEARGNVYAAVSFLEGLALEEVDTA
jgi:hypothetical protein